MVNTEVLPPEIVSQALEATGQAMFQCTVSAADQVFWSDGHAANRLFSLPNHSVNCTEQTPFALLNPENSALRDEAVAAACKANGSYCVEYFLGDEEYGRWLEERGMCLPNPSGTQIIGVVRSVDDQKNREQHLHHLAKYDELTGQLNRNQFTHRVSGAIEAQRNSHNQNVLMLIGIDAVGRINNDFGFDVADQVIFEVANRIKSVLGEATVCGRIAGTKFGILVEDGSSENILRVARGILNTMREKIVSTHAGCVAVSVCIGATLIDQRTESAAIALAETQAAFDQARRKGPSSFEMFSETTETVSRRQKNSQLTDVILNALNEHRVYLVYQPIVPDINTHCTKYECLIRMEGEDGEEMPAPSFIPAAERLGLVHLLDRRVLELATQALSQIPEIELNVNLSWETLRDPVWAEGYLAHLRTNRKLCNRLTIELTETQVVDAIEASIEFVSAIKVLGCKFAIDDFGAGYTSFRNLKALDIDVLKIDGSFISGVSSSRDNQLFVRTLLDLARNFSLKTVAEWVDNDADATLLKALGVDYLQGFYLGKPEAKPEWHARLTTASKQSV